MAVQTIIDNACAQLYYHDDTKIVHHHWMAELDSVSLRESLTTGNALLRKHHAEKWLSDNRFIKPHSDEDEHWINTQWLPDAISAGWKYWALVVPDAEASRINMVTFVDEFYEKGVRVMVFTNPDQAMEWLIKVDQAH